MQTMAEQEAEIAAIMSDGSSHEGPQNVNIASPVAHNKPHFPPPKSAFQSLPLVHPKKNKTSGAHKSPASPGVSTMMLNDSLSNIFQEALSGDGREVKVLIEPEMAIPRHSHRSQTGHRSRRGSMNTVTSTRSRSRRGSMNTVTSTRSRRSATIDIDSDDDDIGSFALSDAEQVSSLESPSGDRSRRSGRSRNSRSSRRRSSGDSSSSSSISLWSAADPSQDFQVPGVYSLEPSFNPSLSFNQHNGQSFASLDTNPMVTTNEDSSNNKTLFDNLDLHWPETTIAYGTHQSITTKHYQQACLASFVLVFGAGCADSENENGASSLPPLPTASVVIQGLWARVVLPAVLQRSSSADEESTSTNDDLQETADMLAQEAWTALTSRLGFLCEKDDATVSVVHSAFIEYGLKLADEYGESSQWKSSFAFWLQKVFLSSPFSLPSEDTQTRIVPYAAKALLPLLLECGMYSEATNLLVETSSEYTTRLWEALHKEENAVQLTERYVVGNVERYVSFQQKQLDRDSATVDPEERIKPCSPQEVLEMYDAWYRLLQRQLEDIELPSVLPDASASCHSSDACSSGISEDESSVHSDHSGVCESDKQQRRLDRKHRRERRRQRRRQLQESRRQEKLDEVLQNPLPVLILGRALHILAESVMESSFAISDDGAATSLLWRRHTEYIFQAMQVFSIVMIDKSDMSDDRDEEATDKDEVTKLQLFRRVATLLCADSWVAQSECLGTMQDNECEVDEFQLLSLSSLFAPCIKTDTQANAVDPRLNCLEIAQALLENPIDISPKKVKITKRLKLFRDTLRGDINDAIGRLHFNRRMYVLARIPLDEAVRRKRAILTQLREAEDPNTGEVGMLSLMWSGSDTDPSEQGPSIAEEVVEKLNLSHPTEDLEKEISEAELSLSESLEYTALVMHENGFSMPALSLLQESLLLKQCHLGKTNMEVARLNAAMATIHDDVMQWEAALPRRRECLRIRMSFLSQYDPSEWITQHEGVFQSVLDILRAMGNSHRMLDAYDDAIGCFWKIAALARRQWEVLRDDPNECTRFYGFAANEHQHRLGAELRETTSPTIVLDEVRYESLVDNNSLNFMVRDTRDDQLDKKEDTVLREVAQSHQTIISLFKDKEFASRKIQQSSSNRNLADVIAEEDIPLLLTASYELGILHMYYGDYRSALHTLEHSLQSMWIMDPSSSESSGSDSYSDEETQHRAANRKRMRQRRRRHSLGVVEKSVDEIHEEGLYHAVGICRVGCGEHEQAIRFHMTALRYARRFHGPHSPIVAAILYDVASCYWHVREYEKALEFWSACCRIHLRRENNVDYDDDLDSQSEIQDDSAPLDYAKALYNVGATLCAMGRFRNHMTLGCLEEAREIFKAENYRRELASCLFYMSLTMYHRAGSALEPLNIAHDLLKESIDIYKELGFVLQANDDDFSQSLGHGALTAHLFSLQGYLLEAMGNTDLALSSLQTSYNLYDEESSVWNLHKASVLFAIGKIYKARDDDIEALRCFDDAMEIRVSRLGPGHEVVGATLHQLGDMFARRDEFEIALEMYNEARRILVSTGGQDNPLVAEVLLHMGVLQAREGQLGDALESLKGALVIRKHRTGMAFQASRGSSDFAAISLRHAQKSEKQRKEVIDHDDALRNKFNEELARERQALAVVLHCIGNVYNVLRDFDNAIISYKEAIESWKSIESMALLQAYDVPVSLADTLHCLGCVHSARKEYGRALEHLTESLKLKRVVDSPVWENPNSGSEEVVSVVLYNGNPKEDPSNLHHGNSLSYAATLHRIGLVYTRMNNRDAAISCLESALSIQRRLLDGNSAPIIATTLADMGNTLYGAKHRRDEALQYYQAALDIRRNQHADGRQVGELLYRIGSLHDADRQCAQAMMFYRQAIQVYGRRYVHAAGRRLCQAMLLRSTKSESDNDDDGEEPIDLFHADGAVGSTPSLEEREEANREHFRKICSAMRKASQSANTQELSVPSCWISFELYLYSLMDLLHLVNGEWRREVRQSLQSGLRQLQPGANAPLQAQDTVVFRMLYLIQD